ncbi:zinc-binding dehydrogenase [Microbacterium marinilacus]|uniref:Zinc-binding dehydrogenase n=1 Tax=Microbacterium marinilacus TaxID=415209 RepID=A0ABP7BNH6_9MICO|nr:zinc-binding dehydrogenase [Microbacterium marinilacus]
MTPKTSSQSSTKRLCCHWRRRSTTPATSQTTPSSRSTAGANHTANSASSPANLVKSLLPGPYHAVIAQPITADLEQIAQDARSGKLRLPVARTVSLSQAIPALIDLEQGRQGKRGKLVIVPD